MSLESLLRELAPQVLGAVMRRVRDFAAAEDAVQEALVAAASQWPAAGTPDHPRGWLIHVAMRRLTDAIHSDAARRRREEHVVSLVPAEVQRELAELDDTLVLLFTCCHASLSSASAIALTLRAVGGLTTAEIARAFLVPEATMAQRISRAKQTIATSGVPLEVPDGEERAQRLRAVMRVLYLIFNEGYTSSAGEALHRTDLSSEAIRLARLLHRLAPDDAEAAGLLALMLLTDARRPARTGDSGELIPLEAQDRSTWDRDAIAEGTALVEVALSRGPGEYAVLAAIAALHDEAPSAGETDWPQILALYEVLAAVAPSPMVDLGRAVADAMVHGPAAGLARLAVLDGDPRAASTHRLAAVRAHLLERAGDRTGALAAYERAAGRATNVPERDYLRLQAARLREG